MVDATRVAIDTGELFEVVEHVLEEADLLETWMESFVGDADSGSIAGLIRGQEEAFEAVMNRTDHGKTLRRALRNPATRAGVRRIVNAEIKERRATGSPAL